MIYVGQSTANLHQHQLVADYQMSVCYVRLWIVRQLSTNECSKWV